MHHLEQVIIVAALTFCPPPPTPPSTTNADVITPIATAVAAIAATIAAIASIVVIFVYRKQVEIGQKQVKISQRQTELVLEAQYDQHRPLLFPTGNPDNVTLHNGGSGIALNIRGVFFSREPSSSKDTVVKHMHWLDEPLEPKESIVLEGRNKQQITIDGSWKIGNHALYAPKAPTLEEMNKGITPILIRLTLTYHDIFGRKHASTFDYTNLQKWVCVENQSNIPQDIEELNRKARSETAERSVE